MESLAPFLHQLAVPAFTGLCTAFACFIVMRNDMQWIKTKLQNHENMLWELRGMHNTKRK